MLVNAAPPPPRSLARALATRLPSPRGQQACISPAAGRGHISSTIRYPFQFKQEVNFQNEGPRTPPSSPQRNRTKYSSPLVTQIHDKFRPRTSLPPHWAGRTSKFCGKRWRHASGPPLFDDSERAVNLRSCTVILPPWALVNGPSNNESYTVLNSRQEIVPRA